MKKIGLLLLLLVLTPFLLMAQTAEDKRRIEEEKRESLRPSEVRILWEEREKSYPELTPIKRDYFAELLSKRVAFFSDACRVLTVLMGVENQYKDFDSQIAFFKERNIIPRRIALECNPAEPLCKGLTAYMFCEALGIKGGLWLRLFGMNQRYALRELVFEGIMSPGNINDIVSGKELIFILTQAANYLSRGARGR
jgi:hypothetical protein